jgi:hypothetical protein
MLLKALPFHSFLHARACFASQNFMSTMYLFALLVLMSLKCDTSSRVRSPTKPRKSDGVMYEGTARMHSVVQSCSEVGGCALDLIVQAGRFLAVAVEVHNAPADLCVLQIRGYELALGREAARALGLGGVLERLGARSRELVAIARVHVDAQNRDGVEAPVPVRKALCPPVAGPLGRLDGGDGAVVVVRERQSCALAKSPSGRRSFAGRRKLGYVAAGGDRPRSAIAGLQSRRK